MVECCLSLHFDLLSSGAGIIARMSGDLVGEDCCHGCQVSQWAGIVANNAR